MGFSDGSSGEIDFEQWLVGREGLFAALRDLGFFTQVRVDLEAGTLCWPNGVDLCPDVLRHYATAAPRFPPSVSLAAPTPPRPNPHDHFRALPPAPASRVSSEGRPAVGASGCASGA
ncbi:MAG: DUF2442 domain-containing protein [Candidatus Moduliflexus flocculans]|nr:DUF2442 domain-containing protein [Candidatus Moduliflexus flocculans]